MTTEPARRTISAGGEAAIRSTLRLSIGKKTGVFFLCLAFLLGGLLPSLHAAEAPPPPPISASVGTDNNIGPLDPNVLGLEDPSRGRITVGEHGVDMVGGVFVASGGEKFRADSISCDADKGEIVASGGVLLEAMGWTLLAEEASYNVKTRSGVFKGVEMFRSLGRAGAGADDAGRIEQGEVDLVVIRADVVRKDGATFTADGASVTSCGFYTPHYAITAEKLTVTPDGLLTVHGARLKWGNMTLFRLNELQINPEDLPYYLRPRGRIANDAQWGLTLEAGLGIPGHDGGCDREILLSYRSERGPGLYYEAAPFHSHSKEASRLRFSAVWEGLTSDSADAERAADILARRASMINGTPSYVPLEYYLYFRRRLADAVVPPDMSQPLYADDLRYLLDYRDHISLGDDAYLDVSLYKVSDRDYAFEYDEAAYLKDWYRGSHVRLGGSSPYGSYRVHTAFRTDDSVTLTEYLPEVRLRTYPFGLPGGFYMNTEVRSGFLKRYFDPTMIYKDFFAFRTHTAVSLERPVYANAGISLTPFVTVRNTQYSESRAGGTLLQSGLTAGATASAVVTGRFPAESGELIHVVRGALTYSRTPGTSADPIDVYDFDEVDDFMAGERLSLRIDQRLKRCGTNEDRQLARLVLSGTLLLDDAERQAIANGSRYGPLTADLLVQPVEPLHVFAAAEWLPGGGGLQDIHAGIKFRRNISPGENGLRTFGVSYRELAEDTADGVLPAREIMTSFGYDSGRWGVDAAFAYELEDNALVDKGTILSRVVFTRDLHDLSLSVGASYNWADDEYSFSLRLTTRGYTAYPAPID